MRKCEIIVNRRPEERYRYKIPFFTREKDKKQKGRMLNDKKMKLFYSSMSFSFKLISNDSNT